MDTIQSTKRTLNAGEVCLINNALDRHAHQIVRGNPGISRQYAAAKLSALLEIMDVLNLEFEDDSAASNAISQFKEFNSMRLHVNDSMGRCVATEE